MQGGSLVAAAEVLSRAHYRQLFSSSERKTFHRSVQATSCSFPSCDNKSFHRRCCFPSCCLLARQWPTLPRICSSSSVLRGVSSAGAGASSAVVRRCGGGWRHSGPIPRCLVLPIVLPRPCGVFSPRGARHRLCLVQTPLRLADMAGSGYSRSTSLLALGATSIPQPLRAAACAAPQSSHPPPTAISGGQSLPPLLPGSGR